MWFHEKKQANIKEQLWTCNKCYKCLKEMDNIAPSSYPRGGYKFFEEPRKEVKALAKNDALILDLQGTFLPNNKIS